VLPFSEVLDYSRFSIRVGESDVERLPELLDARLQDADRSNTTLFMIERFQASGQFRSPYLTTDELAYLDAQVSEVSLHCDDTLAVVRKRP